MAPIAEAFIAVTGMARAVPVMPVSNDLDPVKTVDASKETVPEPPTPGPRDCAALSPPSMFESPFTSRCARSRWIPAAAGPEPP